MAANKVLDSSALIAYLEDDRGSEKVTAILQDASKRQNTVFMSAANWAEVLSVIERRHGARKCREIGSLIQRMDLEIVALDSRRAEEAAHIKVGCKLHYLDAFAAALAVEKKAQLVTADRDFEAVKSLVSILWI